MVGTRVVAGIGESLIIVQRRHGAPKVTEVAMGGATVTCLALDSKHPSRLFAGTMEHGLLKSEDGGFKWQPAGRGIRQTRVMSVAVSPTQPNVVWAGTETTGLWRSEDAGTNWVECLSLLN